ncbi:MAG: hypothetical protein PVF83_05140 [Anaerolineales bacterium]|jgi:hypothetical protein
MESLKKKISFREASLVFAICALPVNIWAVVNVLYFVPSWILYRDLWDFFGAISYILFFSLIEIFVLFVLLMLGGYLTPKRWLKDNLIPFSTIIVVEATAVAIGLHYFPKLHWQKKLLALALVVFFLIAAYLVDRFSAVKKGINAVVDRISILSFIYLVFNFLALFIIIIRKIVLAVVNT